MSLKAAASGFAFFLLSVSVVQGLVDWGVTYLSTHICGLKGSTVDIRCTYTYPSRINDRDTKVNKTLWFTKGENYAPEDLSKDPDKKGRYHDQCHENKCTLSIKGLKESDSDVYKFRFRTNQPHGYYTGIPGVNLSVTEHPDLQVLLGRFSTQLECHSRCNVPDYSSYVWYNNSQKMDEETAFLMVSVNVRGNYSCAIKGHEDRPSPPVYAPKVPSVSVCPSGDIVEGGSVSVTCSSDANPAATYTWYKKKEKSTRQSPKKGPLLVFSSIQSSDSGEYICAVQNLLARRQSKSIFIDVKYAPKSTSVSVSPPGDIVEGSSVNLTCSSDANPAANYTWYKDKKKLFQVPGGSYYFTSISSEDRGIYHCKSENKYGQINSSLLINVKYAPKRPFVSVSPSGEIMEGSSWTLTCSSDANPAANYTWYKKNQKLSQEPQGIYHFISISSEDSGDYFCKAANQYGQINSSSLCIDVQYAPKLPSLLLSPSGEIMEGSSVNVTCGSDANPAANYTWYKENQTLLQGTEGIYRFTSVSTEDRGIYYCKSENQYGQMNSSFLFINVLYAPKVPSVSVSPSGEIVEGSLVNLTCSSDANPAANYTLYKESQILLQGTEGIYHFTSISSEDRGTYYCKSENQYGQINSSSIFINVQYSPKLPSVSVSPSGEIMEGSSVNLTCSSDANPAANYTWYKNQKLLQGPEGIYRFNSISSEDRGIYYCKSDNQYGQINSSSIFINVQYAPKLPTVSVRPSDEIMEGSTVNLTCSSDANPAANYTWYKENGDSPKASGQIFTITNIRPEHSGKYYCEAQNRRGRHGFTLHLTVVTRAWKLIAAFTVPAFFLTIILIPVLLRIMKKRAFNQTSGAGERPDNSEQIQPADRQDDIHYASVHFSKNQADPIYSNIKPAQPRRYKEKRRDEEETVEYAAVTFNNASTAWRTRRQEAVEKPAALYSTINKLPREHRKRNL